MNRYLVASCVLLSVCGAAWGYASGAPSGACSDMTPQHHVDPQTTPFPYVITANKKIVKPGDKVKITISGGAGAKDFKGFLIQARVGDTPVGIFSKTTGAKIIDCAPGKNNAATHDAPVTKNKIQVEWTAPPNLTETVQFYVTVAKDGGTYWVKVPSKVLNVKSA